jgi:hypothetical protein
MIRRHCHGLSFHGRHLSAGQRAMLVAKARSVSELSVRAVAEINGVTKSRISQTNVVLEWAPDLVDQVIAGGCTR